MTIAMDKRVQQTKYDEGCHIAVLTTKNSLKKYLLIKNENATMTS